MVDSKVRATIAVSMAIHKAIAQSQELVVQEETEEQGRVRAKEDFEARAGRAEKLGTRGTTARKVPKEVGRVEEKEDGKGKADGVEREREFPWRIIGLEFRSIWEDRWKESKPE